MDLNFQITKSFDKDLKKFGKEDKEKITESINKYCSSLLQNGKIRGNKIYQPHNIKLIKGLDASLYVLRISRKIRVVLTIDEDPLFEQYIITLLRVVNADDAEKVYTSLSHSLYQPILAQDQ